MPPLSVPNLGRGRRSNSSTSCCAGCTSRSPRKHLPTPRPSVWTPAPPGKYSGTARPHLLCSTTAAPGWWTTPNNDILSTIDIFVKDMGLVTEAARTNAYPNPLAPAAEQLYLAGRRAGLGRADDSSLIQILRGTATAST